MRSSSARGGPLSVRYQPMEAPGKGWRARADEAFLVTMPPRRRIVLEMALLPLGAGCLWLFLFTATGAASYFFHPRSISIERQNRAITLSYYACAPLALTPIVALCPLYIYLADGFPFNSDGIIAPLVVGRVGSSQLDHARSAAR